MTIQTQVTSKTKCDARDCKNDAQYYFETKGRNGKCFLCAKCLAELSTQGIALRTPKSPKNTIKKKMEMKQEEE